ncbi:MAG: hypothetical protein ACT6S0_20355 [Roseateles sp.]|uniref:hypothetical protein n=1 Tax=Roseateles sp. TaxID=1971397 RepID=UPI00403619A1
MQTYATIERRVVRILGHPNSGWSPADPDDDNALEIEFRFAVTGDGNKGFLLVYQSSDGRYAADSWHATMEEAFDVAQASYGITRSEWMAPNPVP